MIYKFNIFYLFVEVCFDCKIERIALHVTHDSATNQIIFTNYHESWQQHDYIWAQYLTESSDMPVQLTNKDDCMTTLHILYSQTCHSNLWYEYDWLLVYSHKYL